MITTKLAIFFSTNVWGQKIYLGIAIIMTMIVVFKVVGYKTKNPKKYLDLIIRAGKEGHMVVGKMSCLLLKGKGESKRFIAEYMYVVNDKQYFVTYEMKAIMKIDDQISTMNADMLLLQIGNAMILYYDEKKPQNVCSKLEIYTSEAALSQVATPRENVWRDTEKIWVEAIDMT